MDGNAPVRGGESTLARTTDVTCLCASPGRIDGGRGVASELAALCSTGPFALGEFALCRAVAQPSAGSQARQSATSRCRQASAAFGSAQDVALLRPTGSRGRELLAPGQLPRGAPPGRRPSNVANQHWLIHALDVGGPRSRVHPAQRYAAAA